VRLRIRGPSNGNPSVEDDFPYTPPTLSERFYAELLSAMSPERGRVHSAPLEGEVVPGQLAAAVFTNNRNDAAGKTIYVIRKGPRVSDIGYVTDLNLRKFMPGNFLTLEAVGRFVLYWLLGADP
jgi:hypothetical protein